MYRLPFYFLKIQNIKFCLFLFWKEVIQNEVFKNMAMEVTGRRGRRRKQLLNDLKETREYWKLKEEAPDRTLW